MKSEQELIEGLVKGEMEAFTDLYDMYVKKVYNYIYFRTYHKETAEDLTSVTFTKAYEKIHTFANTKGNFGPWIYRIARNTVIDHYRTQKSTSDIFEAYDLSDKTNIELDFDVSDQLEKVKEYLKTISPDHRDLVIMRVWDGLSYKEIAEILGKSEASLKVMFSRVMSKLKSEILVSIFILLSLIN